MLRNGLLSILVLTLGAGLQPGAARADAGADDSKLEPSLARSLEAAPSQTRDVILEVADPQTRSGAERSASGSMQLSRVRASVAVQQSTVLAATRRAGLNVVYVSPYAGIVVVRGVAAGIRAASTDPWVQAVHPAQINRLRLDVSRVVVQADLVNARGIDGDGVKVAIVEDGRIAGDRALPASRRQVCSPGIPGEPSFHKTAIAGIIQSTDRIYKGMAPRVTLIDGNAADLGDAAVMAAIDCAIERGAVAVNLSFGANTDGAYTGLAAYVDRVVYNTGVSIVVAVSDDCTLRMGSPEVAYNDISVGAFSDRNTTALADDRHTCDRIFDSTFSAYRDPPSLHGDREQPDVVAPGQLIHTINLFSGSFDDLDGTSFAAPHVVGEVALLNERAGPALAHQAERVRAVIMASARHNIEGATRLSDKDGAGAVRFAAADNVLRLGESWWFQTRGGSEGFPHVRTFRATLGQRVRVALVWAHKPGFCSRTVSTNLDLRVSNPVGGTVGVSASQDNNFELVEFTAGATGTYRIRVDDARPSPGAEFVGLAVSRNFN